MSDFFVKVSDLFKTPDVTNEMDSEDIKSNKVMGVLAYLSILVLIPIFAAKKSKFARFHSNQGLVLLLADLIVSIVISIIGMISVLAIVASILNWVRNILVVLLMIYGIINVCIGRAKELPVIGSIKLLK